MKKFFLSLLGLSIILIINAQAPDAFSYQAVIRNSDGTIKQDETVLLQIEILQGSVDGSSVYLETHNSTTNSFGHVSLEIGRGASSDDFSNIDWSSGPYYLSLSVNGTNMGATQLLSVPYAIYATKADGLTEEIDLSPYATKTYVDDLEARLATLEEIVESDQVTVLTSTGTEDDATVTLAVQETISNGSGNNKCEVHVVVTGDFVSLLAGDEINVFLYEDDIASPDLLWNITHIVTAAEEVQQRVDINYDCSSSLISIPAEMGNQLEIYARVDVVKANCGLFCVQDSAVTPSINVSVTD